MEHIFRLTEINGGKIVESEYCEEIIRCRDCKYFNESGECENDIWDVAYGEGYPYVAGAGDGNGFCAWAERVD